MAYGMLNDSLCWNSVEVSCNQFVVYQRSSSIINWVNGDIHKGIQRKIQVLYGNYNTVQLTGEYKYSGC